MEAPVEHGVVIREEFDSMRALFEDAAFDLLALQGLAWGGRPSSGS